MFLCTLYRACIVLLGVVEEVRIQQYLKAGDVVNARDADGRTALLWAVYGGHLNICLLLLAAGADASIHDNRQVLPFHMAAQDGKLAIVTAFIRAHVNIDAVIDSPDGGTALAMASFTGDQAMVTLLLDAGCNTSITSTGGHHPLRIAARKGHTEVVRLLIDAGADVNAICPDGITALTAGVAARSCGVIRKLLEGGANINQPGPRRRTALHAHSCARGI